MKLCAIFSILVLLFCAVSAKTDPKLQSLMKSALHAQKSSHRRVGAMDIQLLNQKEKAKRSLEGVTETVGTGVVCSIGPCCVNGFISKPGTACQLTNPCLAPAECNGFSPECNAAPKLPDGTDCFAGKCKAGLCVAQTKKELIVEAKKKLKAEKEAEKKVVSDASKPAVPVMYDSQGVPQRAPPAPGTKRVCKSGACCDQYGQISPKGFPCVDSKHPCREAASTCDGFNFKCPRFNKPDGTSCPSGICYSGECISADTKKKELPKPKPKLVPKPIHAAQNIEEESEESRKRRQEIAEIRERLQVKKNLLEMIKKANMHLNGMQSEKDLAERARFPFESKAKAETDGFDIHDFVKRMTDKKALESLKKAAKF
jgi:hypothetical protein